MLQNYLIIALRNLFRRKAYSFINIGGLAIGIAACILIGLYVRDELSFDRFHAKGHRIYRVLSEIRERGASSGGLNSTNGWPVGLALQDEFPEVEAALYLRKQSPPPIKHKGEYFYEDVIYADESFLQTFSFPLLSGDPATALKEPFTLLITEAVERKYFDGQPALGKTITFYDSLAFTVTGVLPNVPENSHMQFDMVLSFATFRARNPRFGTNEGWFDLNMYNYVLLREGADVEAFKAKARNLGMQRAGDFYRQYGYEMYLAFQPLHEIYLNPDTGNGLGPSGNIAYVYLLSAIGLFVMLIACINFVNLATARAVERAREVGVRKVIGSTRLALIGQFMGESLLTCMLALAIALGLVALAFPLFNELSGKLFSFPDLLRPDAVLLMLVLVILVSGLAGFYPAFMLSGFKPVQTLKGNFTAGRQGIRLRQGLVVFQFAVSCALIIGTLVVFSQLRYMQSRDLGFTREQILVLDARKTPWATRTGKYETIKQELQKHTAVKEVSATQAVPGRTGWQGQIVFPEGRPKDQGLEVEYLAVDYDFVQTFGLELVAGRNLSADFTSDQSNALLINETAVWKMGWETPANAIGKKIDSPSGYPQGVVVGVVKDYHQHGLQERIAPVVMDLEPEFFELFAMRINPAEVSATLAHLESTWNAFFAGYPMEYSFLDEDFARQYTQEVRLTKIFTTFSSLAILIACLGLFGLVAFTTVQRTKEIGIRKVLGASVPHIAALLAKDFLKLVTLAFLLAAPLAWYFMNRWLEAFAYRISISFWIFGLAGSLALLIALLTVSWQSITAALVNPVKSLRNE
jgi:putative ABC transport system permease protein